MIAATLDITKRYTFVDYLKWATEEMVELFDGFVKLFPAPSSLHQKVSWNLNTLIGTYLLQNTNCNCSAFTAPFTVRFAEPNDNPDNAKYVFQPDLSIICDPDKITKYGCLGAPDLIIEIQSPASAKYDLQHKFQIYEKFGVTEYWIIYPSDKVIEVYILKNGKYIEPVWYENCEKIPVTIFKDCQLDLKMIFN